ncbi:MAG: SDR family NAD(P)-dependent oxidoreductase [Acholeplasmatales bacterium]|nr:SDR family NAD(P)-dependent oxidoreductase [Acholeplasmatales bacterium]
MKALITGASSGIGRDITRLLVDKYDEFVLVGINLERLIKLKKELLEKNNNLKIETVSTDLSKKENCIELYNSHKDIDLLINNAGFGDYGYFDETNLDKDLAMIDTNITALHILCKLYVTKMIKKNSGHILNTASIAGFLPGPLMTTYYATKNYVVRLSEGIREELRRKKSKVKISILCPGPVKTNFEVKANVKFNFNGVDSKFIAKYAVKHMNRFYIIPQYKIKLIRLFTKFTSSKFQSKIVYNTQNKRKGKQK